jgi:hypothetical protein
MIVQLLFGLTNAQNLTALLNPQLTMQCQLAINSNINEFMASCLSPYDLQYFQGTQTNTLDTLINSFSFLPTVCSPDCRRGLVRLGDKIQGVCKSENLVNPQLGGAFAPTLIRVATTLMTAMTPPTNGTAAPNPQQAAAEVQRVITGFFSSLNTQNTINALRTAQTAICVKNNADQRDQPNLLDNKYCMKEQYPQLKAMANGFATAGNTTSPQQQQQMMEGFQRFVGACNVCIQHQLFVLQKAMTGTMFAPIANRLNEGLGRCNLPRVEEAVLLSGALSLPISLTMIAISVLFSL